MGWGAGCNCTGHIPFAISEIHSSVNRALLHDSILYDVIFTLAIAFVAAAIIVVVIVNTSSHSASCKRTLCNEMHRTVRTRRNWIQQVKLFS